MDTAAETLRKIMEMIENQQLANATGEMQLNEYATWKNIEDETHKALQVATTTAKQKPGDAQALLAALNSCASALQNAYSYIHSSQEMAKVRSGQA
jgi:hypothetical protein